MQSDHLRLWSTFDFSFLSVAYATAQPGQQIFAPTIFTWSANTKETSSKFTAMYVMYGKNSGTPWNDNCRDPHHASSNSEDLFPTLRQMNLFVSKPRSEFNNALLFLKKYILHINTWWFGKSKVSFIYQVLSFKPRPNPSKKQRLIGMRSPFIKSYLRSQNPVLLSACPLINPSRHTQ